MTPCRNFPISRRTFFSASAALGAALATGTRPARAARKPNVILVMTDDQGYGDLSCHGNPHLKTPNLDRLHGESTRLTDFHVSPTCAPSRAAIMTGRHNNRVGVWHTIMGRSILQRDERTMADYFNAAGYRTGIFGKWHLGDNYPYRPQDRGFQEVLVHGGGGVGQTPDFWGNNYIDDTYFHNGTPKPFAGYCTDVWFDGAMQFIEENRDAPFFCYLPTNAPHHPYIVPPEFSAPFKDAGMKDDPANFYGMLANFDQNMGRLLGQLDALQLADNTIFIFMTDNGTAAGDGGGMRGAKGSEYEGGHRVPCFIRWPGGGIRANADLPMLTSQTDLLPTLLELCGLKASAARPFDGISLKPWLAEPNTPEPDRAIVVDSQRIELPEKWRKSAVLEKDWRLVNGEELYDLTSDPEQKNNVASAHPDRVTRMREIYDAWWESISPAFDDFCPLVIGAMGQGPSQLNAHDWHVEQAQIPWHQKHILQGLKGNGFWAIDVAEDGEYQFDLRRWPLETDAPINAAIDGGTALAISEARIAIAGLEQSKPVNPEDRHARFTLKLNKGETRLNTTFTGNNNEERGAYYCIVERVS